MLFTIQADGPSKEKRASAGKFFAGLLGRRFTTTAAAKTEAEKQPAARSTVEADPIQVAALPTEEEQLNEEQPNENNLLMAALVTAINDNNKNVRQPLTSSLLGIVLCLTLWHLSHLSLFILP